MLIAEIGLCHFGSLEKAKSLIIAARDAGADAVKTQFVDADEVAKYGSLPIEFYRESRLSREESQELYDFAFANSIPLFFSYFTSKPENPIGPVVKYSAKQAENMSGADLTRIDSYHTIISVNRNFPLFKMEALKKSHIMYASDYMTVMPLLGIIHSLSAALDRRVGYSDHCINPDIARVAIRDYDLLCLEKHFYVGEVAKYKGQEVRDTIHAARPKEFELIASTYKKKQSQESKNLVNRIFPRRVNRALSNLR